MKKVLVLLISIFTLSLNVSADSDHGICAGKEVTGEGYCTLESGVSISGVAFNPSVNNLTNGKSAAKNNYRGGINGKTENLYCIDSNLISPSGSSYNYASKRKLKKTAFRGFFIARFKARKKSSSPINCYFLLSIE